jgi:pimeloyl-ACP methyl ester carboxylesterase
MNRTSLWVIVGIVILLLIIVYAAASWYFSSLMIASPSASLEDARAETGDPADYGLLEPEEVRIQAGDISLAGWFFDNPADGACGVMFMHGFTGNRYQALYWAPIFWERGCDILAYDHRGHGESTPAYYSYGYYEKQDALTALRWFEQRTGLTESEIGVAGVSYGAGTAVQLAPMIPDVAFVLADSSYRSLEAIVAARAEERLGRLGRLLIPGAIAMAEVRGNFDAADVSPEKAIAEAQMPTLLIHSRTDKFTPASHSEAIYSNGDQSRTVLHINDWGSPHAADISTDFDAYKQLFDEFMAQFAPDFGLPPAGR